ncbi:hypothetical protein F4679DRAFT_525123 [Xylaria curta]|nr:hypothetical protein F4679DRAFT_525123 [Xylaria curta]
MSTLMAQTCRVVWLSFRRLMATFSFLTCVSSGSGFYTTTKGGIVQRACYLPCYDASGCHRTWASSIFISRKHIQHRN